MQLCKNVEKEKSIDADLTHTHMNHSLQNLYLHHHFARSLIHYIGEKYREANSSVSNNQQRPMRVSIISQDAKSREMVVKYKKRSNTRETRRREAFTTMVSWSLSATKQDNRNVVRRWVAILFAAPCSVVCMYVCNILVASTNREDDSDAFKAAVRVKRTIDGQRRSVHRNISRIRVYKRTSLYVDTYDYNTIALFIA